MELKKIIPTILLAVILISSCSESRPIRLGSSSVEKVVAVMTLEEKAMLLTGTGMPEGLTHSIPRLGVPAIALGDTVTHNYTIFPTITSLASTWNTPLVESVGEAMGNEALEYGNNIVSMPGLNIYRNVLSNHNSEYFSEDPVVSGKIGASIIRGIQSNGVGTSLTNFAFNQSGKDIRISPRALRELYLKSFEIVVKESQPWAVTTSANRINSIKASESSGLLRTILRNEWGFKGMVMAENSAGNNTPAQVKAGSDLLLPGSDQQYNDIIAAFDAKALRTTDINRNATNVLNLIVKTPRFKGYTYSNNPDLAAHKELARQATAEGIVLLKNNNQTLPLNTDAGRIATYDNSTGVLPSQSILSRQAQSAYIALITINKTGANPVGHKLTVQEQNLIRVVCNTYHSVGKKAVVLLNTDKIIETSTWKDRPDAILLAWQIGEEAENVVTDMIGGKITPSGKLPVTFPVHIDKETVENTDYTTYEDDIYVGYRYFDTFRQPVSYPFGYGLSYTTFEYSNPTINNTADGYNISITVTNTGKYEGKEVVQLYLSSPINSEFPKPLKELKAFAKTSSLQPGQSETITLNIARTELASYNDDNGSWVIDQGNYRFLLGASSQDIKQMISTEISQSIVKPVTNVLLPRETIDVLRP